jgi:TonB family protein
MSIAMPVAALALTLTWPTLAPRAPSAPPPARATSAGQYYPGKAARMRVEGDVKIHCIVSPEGRLIGCVVLSEAPQNYGFGAASVAMAEQLIRASPLPNGGDDRVLETTIRWRLPASAKGGNARPVS